MIAAHHPLKDRGETSLQTVVLVPVVFLVVFMSFHVGAIFHNTHVAELAALRGAALASGLSPSLDAQQRAISEVQRVTADLNSTLLDPPNVSFRHDGVHVTVRLKVAGPISFLPQTATAKVWTPWETFKREQDRS